MQDLIDRLISGDRRALARLVTLIENGATESQNVLAILHSLGGNAHIIGVTGSPGAGKSTLVTQIACELRRRDKRVAILAIDPTSPFTGGALLGDRIRMRELAGDPNIYIRSMASRGSVGGLSIATRDVVRALDAAKFDHIIIETVGAGQAEVEIVRVAQSIIVVTVPGMGDDIQALKAGILEIADIFCINKADRPGADQTESELKMVFNMAPEKDSDAWRPPICKTIASTGMGISTLVDYLVEHQHYLHLSGQLLDRKRKQASSEILTLLYQIMLSQLDTTIGEHEFGQLVSSVAERSDNPYTVAGKLAYQLGLRR
jgi:LAO/AO transport system kinase